MSLTDQDPDFYDLPPEAKTILEKHRGVKQLYDWQAKLMDKLLSTDRNIIYSVPTSGGKTLVAELMLLREVMIHKRNALMILPFISIVEEKHRALTPFAEKLGFVLDVYAGGRGNLPLKKRKKFRLVFLSLSLLVADNLINRTIYLASFEKAHVIVTSLLEEGRFGELGLFIVDEMHMIGEGSVRGASLETLIVKCKLAAVKCESKIRMIGMSATLNNFKDMEKFMNAEVVIDNFRPVKLREYIKRGKKIFDVSAAMKYMTWEEMTLVRKLEAEPRDDDREHLRILVGEVVPKSSVLIFCPTKKHCEVIAVNLTSLLPRTVLLQHMKEEKQSLIAQIKEANEGSICRVLTRTLPYGIAYHHSGLTPDERQLIESAFLKGIISCICCTSTLAAGVNLPAQRVIIREPYVGRTFLTRSQYKQMCGRAGRAGFNATYGESFLIVNKNASSVDKEKLKDLIAAPTPQCKSSLNTSNCLPIFMLTLFHHGLVSNQDELWRVILNETLSGQQVAKQELHISSLSCLESLSAKGLFDEKTWKITALGKGVVKSLIDIDKCHNVYSGLKKEGQAFNLTNQLHLIYLATLLFEPQELPQTINTFTFFDSYSSLNEEEVTATQVMGVNMGIVSRFTQTGGANETIKRVYVTLIIYDVIKNKCQLSILADRYQMQRGTLFTLLNQVATCANSLHRFVHEIYHETNDFSFGSFQKLLPDLCNSLTHCCIPELLPLMEIPGIKQHRAKQLYAAGFKDAVAIAQSHHEDLMEKIQHLNRYQALKIIKSAQHAMKVEKDERQQAVDDIPDVPDDMTSAGDVSFTGTIID